MAGYALSPIDLIPDFIPVLGYLDDIILVPLGILLAIRVIPADLLCQFRAEAMHIAQKPQSKLAMYLIIGTWCVGLTFAIYKILQF